MVRRGCAACGSIVQLEEVLSWQYQSVEYRVREETSGEHTGSCLCPVYPSVPSVMKSKCPTVFAPPVDFIMEKRLLNNLYCLDLG